MSEFDQLAKEYFENWADVSSEIHFDAFIKVNRLIDAASPQSWDLILELIATAPSKLAIGYVAAGPLEDFLKISGNKFLTQICSEADINKRFLYALAGVWIDEKYEFYQTWLLLEQKYQLDILDPMDNTPWSDDNPRPS